MTPLFFKLPSDIAARRDLTASDKLVYAIICDRIGENGKCWPGVVSLARDAGVCKNTVSGSIERLKNAGLLIVEWKGNGHKRYLKLPAGTIPDDETVNHPKEQDATIPESETVQNSDHPNVWDAAIPKSETVPSQRLGPNQTNIDQLNQTAITFWNKHSNLPKVRKLTTQRKKHLKARWIEPQFRDHWQEIVETIADSPFLTGENERGWKADFDWMIKNDGNYVKVLEGKYTSEGQTRKISRQEAAALLKEVSVSA